jgi:hypothetical protein
MVKILIILRQNFLKMSGQIKTIARLTGLILFLGSIPLKAQLFEDTSAFNLVKKDIDYIYNMQFDSAEYDYVRIISLYPGHPIVYLLKGLKIYWENYPMLHTSPAHVSFEENMRQCIKVSEQNENKQYEAEYLLADLCARGMLLTFYSDNDLIMEVTPLMINSYKHLRQAFSFTSECTDLYYFTGTYNYYREAYPKVYPVYRSLAFLFPRGNMETGLMQLQKAALNSLVLRAESAYLLTWIYLGFENKLSESTHYSRILVDMYPGNDLYFETYVRNLLLMKKYDEAEKEITRAPEDKGNKFFQGQLLVLNGILQEKKYHNNKQAEEDYNDGINYLSLFGAYGHEFSAYAYFGLSRISNDNGEKHTRKTYRKEAVNLADFKKINFDK